MRGALIEEGCMRGALIEEESCMSSDEIESRRLRYRRLTTAYSAILGKSHLAPQS